MKYGSLYAAQKRLVRKLSLQRIIGKTMNDRDTFRELRQFMDGSESFMLGHQIKKIRTKPRKIPNWTKTVEGIQEVLLRSFPKLHIDDKQRFQAGRWLRIIHYYFRLQITSGQIADELGLRPIAVRQIVAGIKRVAAGGSFDGRHKKRRKRGRPKLISRYCKSSS